jgi:hypothetical protein
MSASAANDPVADPTDAATRPVAPASAALGSITQAAVDGSGLHSPDNAKMTEELSESEETRSSLGACASDTDNNESDDDAD